MINILDEFIEEIQNKTVNAQAHECIRPVFIDVNT